MTTFDRLSVQGIRSYGIEEEAVVKFFKPLTIILGRNGSGKSTIIESMKMAAGGELPPGAATKASRGAAFIHDPRIHNKTEVRAFIKLCFTDITNHQHVVMRPFTLSWRPAVRSDRSVYKLTFEQRRPKITHSANPSSTPLANAAHPQSRTTRPHTIEEINDQTLHLMRVSKPVIANVLFVHQEDSLWPLMKAETLKANFDAIFAATRYTKALDNISATRKDYITNLDVLDADLVRYQEKVARLDEIRAQLDHIRLQHDQLERGVVLLDKQIAQLTENAQQARQLANTHARLSIQLDTLRVKSSLLEKEKAEKFAELQLHLPVTEQNSDLALRSQIEQLQSQFDTDESHFARRSRLIDQLTADIDMKRDTASQRQTEKGRLEQQAKSQRDRLEKLERFKEEILATPDLNTLLVPSSSSSPHTSTSFRMPQVSDSLDRWSHALEQLRVDADTNLNKVTVDGNSTIDAASSHCTDLKVRLEAAKADASRKRVTVHEGRERLAKIRTEVRVLEQSRLSMEDVEGRKRAFQAAYEEKKQSGNISNLEEVITTQKKKMSAAKEDLSAARRTRNHLLQEQVEQASLEAARRNAKTLSVQLLSAVEELVDLQTSAVQELASLGTDSTALDALRSELVSLGPVLEDNVAFKYLQPLQEINNKLLAKCDLFMKEADRAHSESISELQTAQSHANDAIRECETIGGDVRSTKAALQGAIKDLRAVTHPPSEIKALLSKASASGTFTAQVDARPFGSEWFLGAKQTIRAVHSSIEEANQMIAELETGITLAENDLKKFEEDPNHQCPACGIKSAKNVDTMRSNLTTRVEYLKSPERMRREKNEMRRLESTLEILTNIDTLTATALELNASFNNAETEKKICTEKAKAAETNRSSAEIALAKAKTVTTSGASCQLYEKQSELRQLQRSFRRARDELDEIQRALSVSGREEQSLADVDSQVRKLEEDLAHMQDALDRANNSLEIEKDDLRRLEVRYHQAQQACFEQEAKSERRKALLSEKEKINTSISTLEQEIEKDRSASETLTIQLREAEDDFDRTRAENTAFVNHCSSILSKRQMTEQAWMECRHAVAAYVRAGRDKELDILTQSLNSITSEVSSKTEELRSLEREQRTASDSRAEREKALRNLRDNQKYRLIEQELHANSRSKRHLKEERAALERDAGELPAEKVRRLTEEINAKSGDRHATEGRKQVFTESYKDKKKELDDAELEGSRRKFDECRIKKQTAKLASEDLDRYYHALDKALMMFHALKMDSINRTIKDLWQRTYAGTDIEEIEITSDLGDVSGGPSKRNFNYRVEMRQGGAVLGMRGRCSAGQKVLACLVIRMALAESFCADCGVLALDEPTTNLDRANIQNLASALRGIIEIRRKQKNFQLVLITHDQDFIEMIRARDYCNEYYIVYKDISGISHAKLKNLRQMM